MIGLDTNVVVRYLVQDDPVQAGQASALIESLSSEAPGFLSRIALVEMVWILEACYRVGKPDLVAILETLLRAKELVIEQADTVWQALHVFAGANADFADCLIERSAHAAQCSHTVTFDKRAAKNAGMRLLTDRGQES